MPQSHISLWLEEIIVSHQIDSVISAELFDAAVDAQLYEILLVKTRMMYGLCGELNLQSEFIKHKKTFYAENKQVF